jgi:SAM-dependent methyltransferase
VKVCLACEARFDDSGWTCPECGAAPRGTGIVQFEGAGDVEASFPESSFSYLPEPEERSFWFAARNELIEWALQTYFPSARSFFEVGCGTGVVLAHLHRRLPELALAGGEPFRAGLEVARKRLPDVPLFQLDGRRLPFEEEYDVVGAFDVLEHLDEDEEVIAQIHRATKPDGGIVLSVPQHPQLWSGVDEFSRHRRRYTAGELVAKVEARGFRVLRKTSFVSLLLPAVALSRWRDREKPEVDPTKEFRLPSAVERGFSATMRLERALVRRGVSFPAGSSLLLVAKRV